MADDGQRHKLLKNGHKPRKNKPANGTPQTLE
jgi:hypothetical protein